MSAVNRDRVHRQQNVRLLAAADPDSLSGKAAKARDYGINIVNEAGLARLVAEFNALGALANVVNPIGTSK